MTGYSNSFFLESNSGLIDKFEQMLDSQSSYFFDVDDIEVLADHYLDKGNHAWAKQAIRHGLTMHPKSPALMLKNAHALLYVNEAEKALEILEYLEASEPNNTEMLLFKAVVHRNLSDHEGTKACLVKALNATPENKEEIYLDLAFEQEMVEDYAGAISSLKQSLEINPNHEASLFELGYCFDMAQELENGAIYFTRYLDQNPYSFVGWYNLALCYEKLGLFETAIETVGYAIAIKPDFANAYILKGNMYTSCEMDHSAISAYQESVEYDALNPLVFAAIGECHERLENWLDAELNYRKAIDIDPKYVDALMGLGAVKENENAPIKAIALYKEALDYDKLNLDNWHIYAEAMANNSDFPGAEVAYMHITKFFGEDEDAWIALAEIQAKTKGNKKAIKTLLHGKDIIPIPSDLNLQLAKFLILENKVEEGSELLAQILSDNEHNSKYFLSIFPEAIQIPNIAALIDLYTSEKRK